MYTISLDGVEHARIPNIAPKWFYSIHCQVTTQLPLIDVGWMKDLSFSTNTGIIYLLGSFGFFSTLRIYFEQILKGLI